MRKMRNAAIAALGFGMVLVTAPSALADGASENESSIQAGISPNVQSATNAGPATLFSQVQTFDNDEGPATIAAQAAERVTIDFDNDLTINADDFDQCGGQGGNDLDTSTTAQAVATCESAVIGSGQAEALIPTGAPPPAPPTAKLELTISTINGPTTVAGGPCAAPAAGVGGPEGCEYTGGNPQVILHAYNQGLAFITTVGGEIRPSTDNTADYGQSLVVNDAPDTAGDAGSLILFNSTVGAQIQSGTDTDTDTDKGKTKTKKKKKGNKTTITKTRVDTKTVTSTPLFSNYVTATCADDGAAAGGTEYDFKGTWVYDDATVDTDTFKQKCGNPAP